MRVRRQMVLVAAAAALVVNVAAQDAGDVRAFLRANMSSYSGSGSGSWDDYAGSFMNSSSGSGSSYGQAGSAGSSQGSSSAAAGSGFGSDSNPIDVGDEADGQSSPSNQATLTPMPTVALPKSGAQALTMSPAVVVTTLALALVSALIM